MALSDLVIAETTYGGHAYPVYVEKPKVKIMQVNAETVTVPKRGSKWIMKSNPLRNGPSVVKDVRYGCPSGGLQNELCVHWEHPAGFDRLSEFTRHYVPFVEPDVVSGQTYAGGVHSARVVGVTGYGAVTYVNPVTTTLSYRDFLIQFPNLISEK